MNGQTKKIIMISSLSIVILFSIGVIGSYDVSDEITITKLDCSENMWLLAGSIPVFVPNPYYDEELC